MTRRAGWTGPLAAALLLGAACPGLRGAEEARPAAGSLSVNQILERVGIDQRLGEKVPLDLVFRDESGLPVTLGSIVGEKPAVLVLAYYQCPMLCTLVLNGLQKAVRAAGLELGADYRVISVSIDPREGAELASEKKKSYLGPLLLASKGAPEKAARIEAGWRFLTGEEGPIEALARSSGFRYTYNPATRQYAHAAGIMILTPGGTLSRYLLGIEYSSRDLKLALVESAAGKIGSAADRLLLLCFSYDPSTGKYTLAILNLVRFFGVATAAGLGIWIGVMLRRERRRDAPQAPIGAATGAVNLPEGRN